MPHDEVPNYEGFPIWDQIKLLTEWSPLLSFGQRIVAEPDHYKQSLIVADALEWLAAKTKSPMDDDLVNLLDAVVRTPQGEALIRWAIAKVEGK